MPVLLDYFFANQGTWIRDDILSLPFNVQFRWDCKYGANDLKGHEKLQDQFESYFSKTPGYPHYNNILSFLEKYLLKIDRTEFCEFMGRLAGACPMIGRTIHIQMLFDKQPNGLKGLRDEYLKEKCPKLLSRNPFTRKKTLVESMKKRFQHPLEKMISHHKKEGSFPVVLITSNSKKFKQRQKILGIESEDGWSDRSSTSSFMIFDDLDLGSDGFGSGGEDQSTIDVVLPGDRHLFSSHNPQSRKILSDPTKSFDRGSERGIGLSALEPLTYPGRPLTELPTSFARASETPREIRLPFNSHLFSGYKRSSAPPTDTSFGTRRTESGHTGRASLANGSFVTSSMDTRMDTGSFGSIPNIPNPRIHAPSTRELYTTTRPGMQPSPAYTGSPVIASSAGSKSTGSSRATERRLISSGSEVPSETGTLISPEDKPRTRASFGTKLEPGSRIQQDTPFFPQMPYPGTKIQFKRGTSDKDMVTPGGPDDSRPIITVPIPPARTARIPEKLSESTESCGRYKIPIFPEMAYPGKKIKFVRESNLYTEMVTPGGPG